MTGPNSSPYEDGGFFAPKPTTARLTGRSVCQNYYRVKPDQKDEENDSHWCPQNYHPPQIDVSDCNCETSNNIGNDTTVTSNQIVTPPAQPPCECQATKQNEIINVEYVNLPNKENVHQSRKCNCYTPLTFDMKKPTDENPFWTATIIRPPITQISAGGNTVDECKRENCLHNLPKSVCLYDEPCKASCYDHPPGIKPHKYPLGYPNKEAPEETINTDCIR